MERYPFSRVRTTRQLLSGSRQNTSDQRNSYLLEATLRADRLPRQLQRLVAIRGVQRQAMTDAHNLGRESWPPMSARGRAEKEFAGISKQC